MSSQFVNTSFQTHCRCLIVGLIVVLMPVASSAINISHFPVIDVDKSNVNYFSTPIAYYQGALYTVNVEPVSSGLSTGINLNTTVRKAVLSASNKLQWVMKNIDDETLEDKYHTQPSIGIDKEGYLHITYGMHNMPWQYVISDSPGDIASFSFHGDSITSLEKATVKHLNKTPFPSRGTAKIPGNQVTYPAFFYDNNRDLFLTYRFAVRPKLSFKDRAFSGGIASYDVATKKWTSQGGSLLINRSEADWNGLAEARVSNPFAFQDQWAVYLPRLAFDSSNTMHISWLWREGGAGPDASHPSYAYSPNNESIFYKSSQCAYSLPISVADAEWIGGSDSFKYASISEIDVNDDFVYVVLHELGKTRELRKLDRKQGRWLQSEKMPYSASKFKLDTSNGQWAFATGLTVLHRNNNSEKWDLVYQEQDEKQYGFPKVLHVSDKKEFYIHTQSLDQKSVKIYKLEY